MIRVYLALSEGGIREKTGEPTGTGYIWLATDSRSRGTGSTETIPL